jgi:hypothetical protein
MLELPVPSEKPEELFVAGPQKNVNQLDGHFTHHFLVQRNMGKIRKQW